MTEKPLVNQVQTGVLWSSLGTSFQKSGSVFHPKPKTLNPFHHTGGAKVLVDIVTGDLAADSKSNLTVPSGRCK